MYSYLVISLVLFSISPSVAYFNGAGNESCYNHYIFHEADIGGGVISSDSTVCGVNCGYKLYVRREVDGPIINTTGNFNYTPSTTYELELVAEGNGFLGFLIQARADNSFNFNADSEIVGIWANNDPLYKTLRCNSSSMANDGTYHENSATQRSSEDFRGDGQPREVTFRWTSPNITDIIEKPINNITFWFTVVHQLLDHFFPIRGPIGTLDPDAIPSPTPTPTPTPTPSPTPTPLETTVTEAPSTTSESNTQFSEASQTADVSEVTSPPINGPPLAQIIGIAVGAGVAGLFLFVVVVLIIIIIIVCVVLSSKKKVKAKGDVNYNKVEQKVDVPAEKA